MAADISVKVGVDGEREFKKSMQDIVQTSKTLASEMKLVESGFDKNTSAQKKAKAQAEVLTKQIENQQKQVDLLRDRYEKSVKATGENSKESLKLKESLNKAETQLNNYNHKLEECSSKQSKAKEAAAKFGAGLKKSVVAAAKASAVAIGAVSTAAVAVGKKLFDVAKNTAAQGDEIDKLSQRMGLSAEAYQKWDYVLSQSGVDINSMQTGLKTLTNQIGQASNGSADAAARFEQLGISTQDLSTMSREEVFAATIKGLQGMADGTERAALANKLFGKSGQEITPLLNQSAESTEELMKKAEELGFVMSDESVAAAAAFKDSLDTVQRTAQGLVNKVGAELLPSLSDAMTGITSILAGDTDGGVEKINSAITSLIDTVLPNLVNLIKGMLPSLTTAVTSLLDGILQILPDLIRTLVDFLLNDFIPAILNMLPELINVGLEIIFALMDGITQALPSLIPQIVDVVIVMVNTLVAADNIQMIIDAALQLIIALGKGLLQAIPTLLADIPYIITNICKGLLAGLKDIGAVGGQLITGLWNGISDKVGWIVGKIQGFGQTVLNAIKGIFGIHSPSRVMRDIIGKNLALGIGVGFTDEIGDVSKDMQMSLNKEMQFSLPKSATATASTSATSSYAYNIPAINVYAAQGQNAEEIANATLYKLQRQIETRQAVWK